MPIQHCAFRTLTITSHRQPTSEAVISCLAAALPTGYRRLQSPAYLLLIAIICSVFIFKHIALSLEIGLCPICQASECFPCGRD